MKNKKISIICWILTPIIIITLGIYFKIESIPTTIYLREGQNIESDYLIRIKENDKLQANASSMEEKKANASLLGIVPVKSVLVKSVPQIMLYPGGQPVGVKLNTKGVLVVALSDIETIDGKSSSPAANAGVQIGDSIIKVNDKIINSSEQLANEVNVSKGKDITLVVERNGNAMNKSIKPVKSASDNKYKIGLWIRDSTAGVGTLTFYDDKTKTFAALGHPITDVDTGTILRVNTGQIVPSSIVSVRKGTRGYPGELKGIFVDDSINLGEIHKNTECGIFGESNKPLSNKVFSKPLGIALRNEIKEGPAQILTTVEGDEPKLYDIEIQKLLSQDSPGPKSMIIKVTDKNLLDKTGGIVQGMSGSPIIQNNKIVGAVTHVLINKPEVGYGIYIEWMLKDANILSK